jgi:hypothetical protein
LPIDFVWRSYCADISILLHSTIEHLLDTIPPALREPLLQYLEILDSDATTIAHAATIDLLPLKVTLQALLRDDVESDRAT